MQCREFTKESTLGLCFSGRDDPRDTKQLKQFLPKVNELFTKISGKVYWIFLRYDGRLRYWVIGSGSSTARPPKRKNRSPACIFNKAFSDQNVYFSTQNFFTFWSEKLRFGSAKIIGMETQKSLELVSAWAGIRNQHKAWILKAWILNPIHLQDRYLWKNVACWQSSYLALSIHLVCNRVGDPVRLAHLRHQALVLLRQLSLDSVQLRLCNVITNFLYRSLTLCTLQFPVNF